MTRYMKTADTSQCGSEASPSTSGKIQQAPWNFEQIQREREKEKEGKTSFLFKNLLFFIYFWLCWVLIAVCGLSLVSASGGYFLVAAGRRGLLTDFSCSGAQALYTCNSVVAPHERSCSVTCGILVPGPGI